MMIETRPGSIQVLRRAAALLDAIAASQGDMSLTQLYRQVGLNKSTALNILATLVDLDFITIVEGSRHYRLGPRLAQLGAAFEASFEIADIAKSSLIRLRDVTGETASLHVRIGSQRTCVAHVPSVRAIRRVFEIGRRRPLYSGAAGCILLGSLSDEELSEYFAQVAIVALTPNTVTDKDRVVAAMRSAQVKGYATAFQDTEMGANAVAAPIRDHGRRIRAAMVASGPSERFTKRKVQAAIPALRSCSDEVSKRLGWSAPLHAVSAP
jgi:DNA-binding IclR family transcriptional regulator